jgi:hypothetical protein
VWDAPSARGGCNDQKRESGGVDVVVFFGRERPNLRRLNGGSRDSHEISLSWNILPLHFPIDLHLYIILAQFNPQYLPTSARNRRKRTADDDYPRTKLEGSARIK